MRKGPPTTGGRPLSPSSEEALSGGLRPDLRIFPAAHHAGQPCIDIDAALTALRRPRRDGHPQRVHGLTPAKTRGVPLLVSLRRPPLFHGRAAVPLLHLTQQCPCRIGALPQQDQIVVQFDIRHERSLEPATDTRPRTTRRTNPDTPHRPIIELKSENSPSRLELLRFLEKSRSETYNAPATGAPPRNSTRPWNRPAARPATAGVAHRARHRHRTAAGPRPRRRLLGHPHPLQTRHRRPSPPRARRGRLRRPSLPPRHRPRPAGLRAARQKSLW
ncbi:hypothetical protein M2167_005371 [Streptomyces sp. SPB4]|nr:hypothetical protein [Streptomyces sp. SPB4]